MFKGVFVLLLASAASSGSLAESGECLQPHKCQGNFVDSYEMSTVEECIHACDDSHDCRFYTLDRESGICVLYEDCQRTVFCESCASGEKYCSAGNDGEKNQPSFLISFKSLRLY